MSVCASNSKGSSHSPKKSLKSSFIKAFTKICMTKEIEQECLLFFKVASALTYIESESIYIFCVAPNRPMNSKWKDMNTLYFIYTLIYFCTMDSEEILLFSKCGHGFLQQERFFSSMSIVMQAENSFCGWLSSLVCI